MFTQEVECSVHEIIVVSTYNLHAVISAIPDLPSIPEFLLNKQLYTLFICFSVMTHVACTDYIL